MTKQPNAPDPQQTELALLKFNRALLEHWRSYDQQTPMGNVTWNEYYYINALRDGPLNLSELAIRVNVKKSSASTMVTKLEKRGFIQRTHNPSDRREILLQLTEEAFKQLNLEWSVYQSFLSHLSAHLPQKKYEHFIQSLANIAEHLPEISN